jgi:hypothetical protein
VVRSLDFYHGGHEDHEVLESNNTSFVSFVPSWFSLSWYLRDRRPFTSETGRFLEHVAEL